MKNSFILFLLFLIIGCSPKPMEFQKEIFSENGADQDYQIAIVYPKFSGPGANIVNEKILSGIRKQVKKFKVLISELGPENQSSMEGNFNVRFNEYPFLSIETMFEMAIPGTSVLLRSFANINFNRTNNKIYDTARSIVKNKQAENELVTFVEQSFRVSLEDLPCEFHEDISIDNFAYNGRDFLFFVNLYAGNPICQWEVIRVEKGQISHLLKPELERFLSIESAKSTTE